MKKLTGSFFLLFLCLALFGQAGLSKLLLVKPKTVVKTQATGGAEKLSGRSAGNNQPLQIPFWTDDFSIKSNWTMNSPVGNGAATAIWKIDTIGPVGMFKLPKIKSTTAHNGFATFDSDNNCSMNQIADMTTSASISCTGHPFIFLSFQQEYKRYFDSTFVFVSANNTTWTKFPVNALLGVNDMTANPDYQKINISAVAGNQATVWIRFEFYSPASLGASAGCGYSWLIDDAALTDIPLNDIAIDTAFADFLFMGGGYYTQTPISQIVPITFRAAVSNQGTANETNSTLTVKISNGTSTVYNQSGGAGALLGYGESEMLYDTLTPFVPPASDANYSGRWTVAQTQTEMPVDTLNNSLVRTFAVTDTIFARDNGIATGFATGTVNYVGGEADGSAIGNLFLMNSGGTLSSISAFIDTATALGTAFQYQLYSIDSTGAFNLLGSSISYNVNNKTLLGRWKTMPLPMFPLAAGNYLAAVTASGQTAGTNTTPASGVFIDVDRQTLQPLQTTFIYPAGQTPTPSWGFIHELPMIRLNIVKGPAGIKEQTFGDNQVSAWPNPASTRLSIRYSLDDVSATTIDIFDITGKKLDGFKESAGAGTHVYNVDLSKYDAGTYFYSVTTDYGRGNGKFAVIK